MSCNTGLFYYSVRIMTKGDEDAARDLTKQKENVGNVSPSLMAKAI